MKDEDVQEFNRLIIDKTWELLLKTVKELQNQKEVTSRNIVIDKSAKEKYSQIFIDMDAYIKENYMKTSVKYLDRHKTSAIIIYAILKSECIKYTGKISEDEEVFWGNYVIAVTVGFNYMIDRLNAVLKKKDIKQRLIEKLWLPEIVFSCNVPYFLIFTRNLYYANTDENWEINPLEIAEKLFLLEYITVEKKGINPAILKEENNEK